MSDDRRSSEEPSTTEDPMTETIDDQPDTESATRTEPVDQRTDERRNLRRTLNYVLLGGLSLLALIATIQLYLNVSSVINQWVTYEYRSLFQAAFNLTVLLLVGAGMVWQVNRIRE